MGELLLDLLQEVSSLFTYFTLSRSFYQGSPVQVRPVMSRKKPSCLAPLFNFCSLSAQNALSFIFWQAFTSHISPEPLKHLSVSLGFGWVFLFVSLDNFMCGCFFVVFLMSYDWICILKLSTQCYVGNMSKLLFPLSTK